MKVLITMRDMRKGSGVASCIMNYYQHSDVGIQFDFLLERYIDNPYQSLIQEKKSKIYYLPKDTGKPNLKNYKYIDNVIKQGHYDAVHVNTTGLNALNILKSARNHNIKKRIYHVHAPWVLYSLKTILRNIIYERPTLRYANKYVACSESAGESVFRSKPYTILRNAIDINKYTFDEFTRIKVRNELGIESKLVVGTVARISEEKNPRFLIDIFSEIRRISKNAFLLWIGDGPLKDDIIKYAGEKLPPNSYFFAGRRDDANLIYSAMEIFILPSKYEGLGLCFIEAQASGLNCYGSDTVPRDVDITPLMHHISLGNTPKEWAERIMMDVNYDFKDQLRHCDERIRRLFDVNEHVTYFNSVYES